MFDDIERVGIPFRAVGRVGYKLNNVEFRDSTNAEIGPRYTPIDNANNLAFKNTEQFGDDWDWMYVHCPSAEMLPPGFPRHGDIPCLDSMTDEAWKTRTVAVGIPLRDSLGNWTHWHVAATDVVDQVEVRQLLDVWYEPMRHSVNVNLRDDVYYGWRSGQSGTALSMTVQQAMSAGTLDPSSKPLYVRIHDLQEKRALLSICANHEVLNVAPDADSNYYSLMPARINMPDVPDYAVVDRTVSGIGVSPIALFELHLDDNDLPQVRSVYDHERIAGTYISEFNEPSLAANQWHESTSFAESRGQCIDFWYKDDGSISELTVDFRYDAWVKFYQSAVGTYRPGSGRQSGAEMTLRLDGEVLSTQSTAEKMMFGDDQVFTYTLERDGESFGEPVRIEATRTGTLDEASKYPGILRRVPRRGDECRYYFGSAYTYTISSTPQWEKIASVPSCGLYARSNGSKTAINFSVVEFPGSSLVPQSINEKTVKVGAIVSPTGVTTIPEFTDSIPLLDPRYYMYYNQAIPQAWFGWSLGYMGSKINARVCQLTGNLGEGDINYPQMFVNFR